MEEPAGARPAAVDEPRSTVLDAFRRTAPSPVLAHPGADFARADKADLAALKAAGLAGLEVYSSYHDREQVPLLSRPGRGARPGAHGRLGFSREASSPMSRSVRVKEGDYGMVEALRGRRRRAMIGNSLDIVVIVISS